MIFMLTNCSESKEEILTNSQIIAKYEVLDEGLSPKITNCEGEIKSFDKMNKNDCSFTLEGLEFDIEEKYFIDSLGNLKDYWRYKSEGPMVYRLNDLKSDRAILDFFEIEKLNIKIIENGKRVVDTYDTLKIEKVFPKEYLFFVERSSEMKKNKRRLIFEYK
jgi:hypothetical protein